MKLSIECCSTLPIIINSLQWFSYQEDGGKQVKVMPCLNTINGEPNIRINYCPSCGKKIRSIELRND